MTTVTISLPESLTAFVGSQLATKGCGSVSEYFHSLLREAQAKEGEARLEAQLLEGLAAKSLPLDQVLEWAGGQDRHRPPEIRQEEPVKLFIQTAAEADILQQVEFHSLSFANPTTTT
jgi:Arc/MetJ-type ribon-helix-helix transcriptional regulator